MEILYIGYWGAREGLSQSTIYPNLRELARRENVERVHYVSIERSSHTPAPKGETIRGDQQSGFPFKGPALPSGKSGGKRGVGDAIHIHPKIQHYPVQSPLGLPHLLTKWIDFRRVKRQVRRICRSNKIGLVICRSSLAGYFGIYARVRFSLPLVVESFEPHGDYMVDSGTWKRHGLKHRFQTRLERNILEYAMIVCPVSHNHRGKLIEEGANPARVFPVPCYVFPELFHHDAELRKQVRGRLGIGESATVGIYTGKFGDIYYDQEAFDVFSKASRFFSDFRLIILSPQDRSFIESRLRGAEYPLDKVHVDFVSHNEVPAYLSAADFAFSTIRPTPSRRFCSPVKDGEYWAAGLPILIPDGIGDDSQIVKDERAGAILDIRNPIPAFEAIAQLIGEPGVRNRMADVATRHRNFEAQVKVYDRMFEMIESPPPQRGVNA